MNIPYVMKRCTKCGRWLVASTVNFHRKKSSKYGLYSQCKECVSNKNNPVNTNSSITQVCTTCGRELPATVEYFHKSKVGKYGVTAICKECKAEYYSQYYQKHKDKITEHRSQYYQKHKDKEKERTRQWKKDNKDKVIEYNRQWRKDNPDKVAEHNKRRNKKRRQARIDAIIAQKRAEYEAERAPLVAEKTCRCCGRTLPASEFYANKKSKDHLGSYCKECHNKKMLEKYYHNLETKGWS